MNTLGKNKNTTVTTLSSNVMTVTTASASSNMISAFNKQIQKWIKLDNKLKKKNKR